MIWMAHLCVHAAFTMIKQLRMSQYQSQILYGRHVLCYMLLHLCVPTENKSFSK